MVKKTRLVDKARDASDLFDGRMRPWTILCEALISLFSATSQPFFYHYGCRLGSDRSMKQSLIYDQTSFSTLSFPRLLEWVQR